MKKEKYVVIIATVVITAMMLVSLVSGEVSNNDIASIAIGYEGDWGDQCKEFVKTVVNGIAGSFILGSGHTQCYFDAGGIEIIEPNHAMWGDIIQISNNSDPECYLLGDDIYPGMHSAIVLENHKDGNFKVVDSNWGLDEIVSIHDDWDTSSWAAYYGIDVHFYRLGTTDTWDFEIPTYTQGWEHHNTEDNHYSVQDGKYFIDPAGLDPYIQIDGLIINPNLYNALRINVSSNCEDTEAAIYFTTTNLSEYGEDKKIPFAVSNAGTWDIYVVSMREHPLWKNTITGIRIDPANEGISGSNSDTVGFESMELIKIEPPVSQTIYVPDDYPTIQEAADNAEPGDTIIVRDGTYVENIDINTDHLTIKSENGAETTIVQAVNPDDNVFEITADYVNVSGFTAKGATVASGLSGFYLWDGNYCNISGNAVNENDWGITLHYSNSNTIFGNTAKENDIGIILYSSNRRNTVSSNTVNENNYGIALYYSDYNTIFSNNIANNNECGVWLAYSDDNTFSGNIVNENDYHGIRLTYSNNNKIYLNNFIDNICNIGYYGDLTNIWNSQEQITYTYLGNTYTDYLGNYWSDYTDIDSNNNGIWDNPYNIDSDADNYPLTQPFENYLPKESSELTIKVFCPVNLTVTDPDGLTINPKTNEILGASYVKTDINGDGDIDDIISIPNWKTGNYKITVIPELGANPLDTYTLEVSANGTTIILAENVSISDIPNNPYEIELTEIGIVEIIQATIDFDPNTLNKKSKGKWVTVYTELPGGYNVADIDVSEIKLNNQVHAEMTPIEIDDYDDDNIADLMVKFDRQAVIDMLSVRNKETITVKGRLTDKTLFEGSDIIRVIDKEKRDK